MPQPAQTRRLGRRRSSRREGGGRAPAASSVELLLDVALDPLVVLGDGRGAGLAVDHVGDHAAEAGQRPCGRPWRPPPTGASGSAPSSSAGRPRPPRPRSRPWARGRAPRSGPAASGSALIRGAAVDAQGLGHARDEEQQPDVRVVDDVALAIQAVVARPVGDRERPLVEHLNEARRVAARRVVGEPVRARGREAQERRERDEAPAVVVEVVELLSARRAGPGAAKRARSSLSLSMTWPGASSSIGGLRIGGGSQQSTGRRAPSKGAGRPRAFAAAAAARPGPQVSSGTDKLSSRLFMRSLTITWLTLEILLKIGGIFGNFAVIPSVTVQPAQSGKERCRGHCQPDRPPRDRRGA